MSQTVALASIGLLALAALDSLLWHSLLAAERGHGGGAILRVFAAGGAGLLALVLLGSIVATINDYVLGR